MCLREGCIWNGWICLWCMMNWMLNVGIWEFCRCVSYDIKFIEWSGDHASVKVVSREMWIHKNVRSNWQLIEKPAQNEFNVGENFIIGYSYRPMISSETECVVTLLLRIKINNLVHFHPPSWSQRETLIIKFWTVTQITNLSDQIDMNRSRMKIRFKYAVTFRY